MPSPALPADTLIDRVRYTVLGLEWRLRYWFWALHDWLRGVVRPYTCEYCGRGTHMGPSRHKGDRVFPSCCGVCAVETDKWEARPATPQEILTLPVWEDEALQERSR